MKAGTRLVKYGAFVISFLLTPVFAYITHRQSSERGRDMLISQFDTFPSVEESINYYRKCKEDRISEAAFLCATEVYWDFYFEGVDRLYRNNGQLPRDCEVLMEYVKEIVNQKANVVCSLAKGKDHGAIRRIKLLKEVPLSKEEKVLDFEDFDAMLQDFRHNCKFAESMRQRLGVGLSYDDSIIEQLFPFIDPQSRAYIMAFHKIILKDWRSL